MSYRNKIIGKYPIKLTLTTFKKLIWDIDEIRFGGEIKKSKGRKIGTGYHATPDTHIFLPYEITITRGKSDSYLHIAVPGNDTQLTYYKNLYGLKSVEDVCFCIAEDILLEIALIVYSLDTHPKKEQILVCVRETLYNRKAIVSDVRIDDDVWNVVVQNLSYNDIGSVAKLNKNIHSIAKRELARRKAFVLFLRNPRNYNCDVDTFIKGYKKYPIEVTAYHVKEFIERRMCIDILRYLKENTNLIERTILGMYRFTCDYYVFLRQIYDNAELTAITYRYLRRYAKTNRMKIEDVKRKMGFIDECYI